MSNYNQLTVEGLMKFMEDGFVPTTRDSNRQLFVQTGIAGMKMIDQAIKREVEEQEYRRRVAAASLKVSKLKVAADITFQEWENLKKMCHSEDRENLTVVEAIIEHYEQRRVSAPNILSNSKNEEAPQSKS